MRISTVEILRISVLIWRLEVPLEKSKPQQVAVSKVIQNCITEQLEFFVVSI